MQATLFPIRSGGLTRLRADLPVSTAVPVFVADDILIAITIRQAGLFRQPSRVNRIWDDEESLQQCAIETPAGGKDLMLEVVSASIAGKQQLGDNSYGSNRGG
ncbi:hypothetical protein MMC34_007923 [Xylographa carneopallida]|nr:hypothetical protein [Xylographa carneopallida]